MPAVGRLWPSGDDVGEEDGDYDSDDDLSETSKELQGLARNSTEVPLWAVSILSVSRTLWSLPTGELGCI